jgi:Cof subfamily protein (haloacid dehalogenase superfamily)
MIRHIFSDMDGTLLNNRGNVTPTTINAFKNIRIPLTLVSARAPMEMAPAIKALGLKDTQIAFNGGLIFKRVGRSWKYISECSIDVEVAAAIIRALSFSFPEVSVSYYDRAHWYTTRMDAEIEFEQKLTGQNVIVTPQSRAFSQKNFKVFKIMMITFDAHTMQTLRQFLEQLEIPNVSIQQSGTSYLEITSVDAKKSRGIDYILTKNQLHTEETAGFGDGHNDLPMLKMVGLPIVMANALNEIKEVASFVTKSNEANGVAYALKTLRDFHE